MERKGLFKVINQKKHSVEGTAFSIRNTYRRNQYYIVTAYHVVAEMIATGIDVMIEDECGTYYVVNLISPKFMLHEYSNLGNDFAVFELFSDLEYDCYRPTRKSGSVSDCIIRGAVQHYDTEFTSFPAISTGIEILHKVPVLTLFFKLTVCEKKGVFVSDQHILKGLSGAPVTTIISGSEQCIGVMCGAGKDYSGPIRYAVPIASVFDGLPVEIDIDYGFEEDEVLSTQSFVYLLLDKHYDFEFSDASSDMAAWHKISDMLFRGIPIQRDLSKIINSSDFQSCSPEIKIALYYYYARIQYKCGNVKIAESTLAKGQLLQNSLSSSSETKFGILANGRRLVEHNLSHDKIKLIRRVAEKIEEIPNANDSYIACEKASLYGRGLTTLFHDGTEFDQTERNEIRNIYREQLRLYQNDPESLARQDVVITSVEWLIALWGVERSLGDDLNLIIRKGFIQSKIRKNDIFFLQCLMVYGISCLRSNAFRSGLVIMRLCAILMKKLRVRCEHEGIYQILTFIRSKYIKIYGAFNIFYRYDDEIVLLKKLSEIGIDLGQSSWKSVLDHSSLLYSNIFERHLSRSEKNIYDVSIEDIEAFL